MNDNETANDLAPHRPLPCRIDRQKVVDQANLVLAEARAIADQSDRSFALLLAERPAQYTSAATSSRFSEIA